MAFQFFDLLFSLELQIDGAIGASSFGHWTTCPPDLDHDSSTRSPSQDVTYYNLDQIHPHANTECTEVFARCSHVRLKDGDTLNYNSKTVEVVSVIVDRAVDYW